MVTSQLLRHRPLDGPFGTEIEIDPRSELTGDDVTEVRGLLHQYQLLVLRAGDLTPDEQVRISGYFATPLGRPDKLSRLKNDGPGPGSGEILYHSDYTYMTLPLYGITLYVESAAPDSARTGYADMTLALARMPKDLRARIEGRLALHLWESGNNDHRVTENLATARGQGAVHPIIWHSPLSGTELISATQLATARIIGMDTAESDELLGQLFEHVYQPDHIYVHQWQTGDLLIWDNVAVQHSRLPGGPIDGRRSLRRATFGLEGFNHLVHEVFGAISP